MRPKLTHAAIQALDSRVDGLFDRLLTRLLGGYYRGSSLWVTADPVLSLPGLYRQGVEQEGGTVDRDLLLGIASTCRHYTDKYRAEAKAATARQIQHLLEDAHDGKFPIAEFDGRVEAALTELWGRIAANVERVVNTETAFAANSGIRTAIEQISTSRGISDPVVVFISKRDAYTCKECWEIHNLPDRVTPRAWYYSEVSSDYHVKGEGRPSWHGIHPHCRCVSSTILPGFGFSAAGRVTYIAKDFSEIEFQRAGETGGVEDRRRWHEARTAELSKASEPLQKAVRWSSLAQELQRNGWGFKREGGEHEIWASPHIPGAALAIKRGHMSGEVPNWWIGKYAKDAGLKVGQDGKSLEPNPQHPFAFHYRKAGLLPQAETTKTWEPKVSGRSVTQVPIQDLVPTAEPEEWKVLQHLSSFHRGRAAEVPPVTVMPDGPRYLIDSGHEVVEAARRHGMTHIPAISSSTLT